MIRRLVEVTKNVVRSDSVSHRGNEALANLLAGFMRDVGLDVNVQQVMHSIEGISKRQFNVIGVLGDPLVDRKIRKGLLLSAHLDTASPGRTALWTETQQDPLNATVRDGRLFGLGVADSKVDFLCKLVAVQRSREKKLKMPVYLVGTCGEEIGMFGCKYLLQSLALNPKFVLVGMPTGLKLAHSHKSLAVYRVQVAYQVIDRDARGFNRKVVLHSYGISSHSAYPSDGRNALQQLVDFIQLAMDNGFELQLTRLQGGDSINQLPDKATAEFYLTSHHFEDFKRFFREVTRSEGNENSFEMEFGGLGDKGIRFLPEQLFPCLNQLIGLSKDLSSFLEDRRDSAYFPPVSTVSLGEISQEMGSTELNFDIRLLPGTDEEKVDRQIREKILTVANQFPNLNITVDRLRTHPSLSLPKEGEWTKTCLEVMKEASIPPETENLSFSTEAGLFAKAGYDALVFGPGNARENIHGPNESLLVSDMEKAVDFYIKLIEKVCL